MFTSYIPIRSGSKGLPDKNIKILNGHPLFAWSIFFASLFTESKNIIVSSDSDAYLDIASQYNCVPLKRNPIHALDSSSTEEAMAADLLDGKLELCPNTEWLCLLQATSPFRVRATAEQILTGIAEPSVDSLISINEETSFLWEYDDPWILPTYNLLCRPRRQEIFEKKHQRLVENGSIYVTRLSSFRSSRLRVSGLTKPLYTSKKEGLEIDSSEEFDLLEEIMKTCDLSPSK